MGRQLITYTVYYKKVGRFIWKRLSDVIEDGIVPTTQSRFFITSHSERFEIPLPGIMLRFSKERTFVIEESIRIRQEQEANEAKKTGETD